MGNSRLFLRLYKKKSTALQTKYSAFLVENTGPILITVTLLQSMHGALPNHLETHPHTKVRGWMIFGVYTFYFKKDTFSPKISTITELFFTNGV